MTLDTDGLRTLRHRIDRLEGRAGVQPAETSDARQGWAGIVRDGGAKPTTTPAVYLVEPVRLDGARSEGAVVSVLPEGEAARVPVLLVGSVPAVGDPVGVVWVGDWWVGRRRGGGGDGILTICCPARRLPATLQVVDPAGPVAIDWDPARGAAGGWYGCAERTVPVLAEGESEAGPGTSRIEYLLECLGESFAATWRLTITIRLAPGGPLYVLVATCTDGPLDGDTHYQVDLDFPASCTPFCAYFAPRFGGSGDLPAVAVYFFGMGDQEAFTPPPSVPIIVQEAGASIEGDYPVTARRPTCGGVPGDPVPGAAVEVRRGGVLIDSGTTGDGGVWTFTPGVTGSYVITVTEAGCAPVIRTVPIGPCADGAATIEVCCGAVRVTVRDVLTLDPLPAAQVRRRPDGNWIPCDGAGQALIELTTAEMLALPPSGGDCSTRLLSIEAAYTGADPGYVPICGVAAVACGSTAGAPSAYELLLSPLDEDGDGIEDWIFAGAIPGVRAALCPEGDCAVPGPAGRGYVPARLRALVWAEVPGESGDQSVVTNSPAVGAPSGFTQGGMAVQLAVDGPTLNGTGTGPFGAGPKLVYAAEVAPSPYPEPPGSGCLSAGRQAYDRLQVWLCHGEPAIVRHLAAIVDEANCPRVTVPGDPPDCATCSNGSGRIMEVLIAGSPDLCPPEGGVVDGAFEVVSETFRGRVEYIQ